MTIHTELIDELLKGCVSPKDIMGEGGLLKELTKAVVECCLEAELETHLGCKKHAPDRKGTCNAHRLRHVNYRAV